MDIVHLQTPSQFSETGAKGMGEGGTIGAPAAVLNAINDALSDTDVRFDHIPGAAAGPSPPPSAEPSVSRAELPMKDMHAVRVTVNGRRHELVVEARRTLADMLRHDLGYTGTPPGLRARHLRRLHGDPGRRAGPGLPGLRRPGRRREVRTVEGLPTASGCRTCSRRSATTTRCSAASAPPASSCWPRPTWPRPETEAASCHAGAGPRTWSPPTCAAAPATRASSRPSWPPPGPARDGRGPGRRTPHERHRHPAAPPGGPPPAARPRPVRRRHQRPWPALGPDRPLAIRPRPGPRAGRHARPRQAPGIAAVITADDLPAGLVIPVRLAIASTDLSDTCSRSWPPTPSATSASRWPSWSATTRTPARTPPSWSEIDIAERPAVLDAAPCPRTAGGGRACPRATATSAPRSPRAAHVVSIELAIGRHSRRAARAPLPARRCRTRDRQEPSTSSA